MIGLAHPGRSWLVAIAALMLGASACTDGPAPTASAPTTESTPSTPTTAITQDEAASLAPDVEARLATLADSGFSGVVVVDDQGATTTRAFGLAERETGTPVETDTVFDIGSITKQFTGAAILRLEMDGLLSVDDRLGDHLDGLTAAQDDITLHQLLTHTAGLPGALGPDYDPVGRDEFIELVAASPLRGEPGSTFEYSNPGYSLLAAVIEGVTGGSYETYLRDALFVPAGMNDTGYVLPDWNGVTIAVGYDAPSGDNEGRPNELPWADDGPYWHLRGNGGILSTAGDMLRWHHALIGDDILDEAAKDAYYAEHVSEAPGAPSFYGYGWTTLPESAGARLITHNGGNGIFFADFLRFPDDDLAIYVATNSTTEENELVAFEIADLLLGTNFSAQMGGNDDLCGFNSLGPDRLPDAPDIAELPPTETGQAVRAFVDVIASGDDASRREFAVDHVDAVLTGGAPPDAVAAELLLLQDELAGFDIVRLQQSDPLRFHLLMESAEETVLVSLGATESTPRLIGCLAIAYS